MGSTLGVTGKKNYLIDMDGVLLYGGAPVPGAAQFLARLEATATRYLILTNNPLYVPADLSHRFQIAGLPVAPERIFTSAMATAMFLKSQPGRRTAYVIGESGLTSPLHEAGFIITDHAPDYVVLGETLAYNFEAITKAIRLVAAGARFIATNPDSNGPGEGGIVPACGAMAALIERASGRAPFYIGKPSPLMMRNALNHLNAHSEETIMVGDRMDTDIVAGVQAGMETILVLTGVTKREDVSQFPYQPTHVLDSVADIPIS